MKNYKSQYELVELVSLVNPMFKHKRKYEQYNLDFQKKC